LVDERREKVAFEACAAVLDDAGPGAFGYEHSDASLLVENAGVDEQVDALAGGCGVDAVERGELVRRRHLGFFGECAAEDVAFDEFGQLNEYWSALVHACPSHVGRLVT